MRRRRLKRDSFPGSPVRTPKNKKIISFSPSKLFLAEIIIFVNIKTKIRQEAFLTDFIKVDYLIKSFNFCQRDLLIVGISSLIFSFSF